MRRSRHPWLGLLAVAVIAAGAEVAGGATALAQSYWFEDYEKSVELIDAGRMREASVLLEAVMDAHPDPAACLRVPGDRCVMYCPYFQRARIQFSQGDLRGAAHSLDVSGAFGAVYQNKRSREAFLALRQQVRTGLGQNRALPTAAPVSKPE